MAILRHIVEDEETLKQIMRAEIRNLFENPQRTQRNLDLSTDEGSSRANQLALKDPESAAKANPTDKDAIVEPAVQATEDLSIHDVKQSTETDDKEMADAPKPVAELKRPVVENPHGIIHFLLCELLNYREVDDKESSQPAKDPKGTASPGAITAEAGSQNAAADSQDAAENKDKDKKSSKPVFKAEDHPIFIYRCFLLNCLAELLQSYNQTKVEFINFKRSAPMQTNTPVKPRSNVLNYLIHDLLCQGNLSDNGDSILSKKKAATSAQAQQVLVALVAKTGEKVIDKTRDRFEYDDEPDLLFAYERAATPEEPVDTRYPKMQCLAELMNHVIGEKDKESTSQRTLDSAQGRSQAQLRRMMYEKGYLDKLTSSIAEVDLSHAGVKRAIKYVLRVLRVLTDTAKELSRSHVIPSTSLPENAEDDIISTSSMSDMDDDREETPDLYRNSTLGMLEPRGSDDESDDEDDEDDEDVDYEAEAQELEEAHMHGMEPGDIIDNLARAVMDPEDYEGDDMDDLGDHYIDDG
ncbi:HECT-domain-containing protein [Colletotrichum higginsianum]|nr:HECT-domain-containing protein [Colletotrichum higginsianum]